jgi:hypothetical protein
MITHYTSTLVPFALNPINLTDSDAIANAFLQHQAEFLTLFAHLLSTFSTSDHSVIHGFLHAQIMTFESRTREKVVEFLLDDGAPTQMESRGGILLHNIHTKIS